MTAPRAFPLPKVEHIDQAHDFAPLSASQPYTCDVCGRSSADQIHDDTAEAA